MRSAAAQILPSRYSVVIVTTDELVPPEAESLSGFGLRSSLAQDLGRAGCHS